MSTTRRTSAGRKGGRLGSKAKVHSALGQPLRNFVKLVDNEFAPGMAAYGFAPVAPSGRPDPFLGERIYQSGKRYIRVTATTHVLDFDPSCAIEVGEGRLAWPEADWNAIAVWQLQQVPATPAPRRAAFPLSDVRHLPKVLRRMRKALERDAADFLEGDLRRFRKARAAWTAVRVPYMIHSLGPDRQWTSRQDSASAALRKRFSRSR
jgi:hypothetical protein